MLLHNDGPWQTLVRDRPFQPIYLILTAPYVKNNREEPFYPASSLASVLGINALVIARLTGRVDLFPGTPFKTDRREFHFSVEQL
jgi:hypothetical protein